MQKNSKRKSAMSLTFGRHGVVVLVAVLASACASSSNKKIEFTSPAIAENVEGAYLMALGDINADGRQDIVLLSVRAREVHWYENPDWRRRTLVTDASPSVVGAAIENGGEGGPRVVLLSGFHRDDYEKNLGELVYLRGGENSG